MDWALGYGMTGLVNSSNNSERTKNEFATLQMLKQQMDAEQLSQEQAQLKEAAYQEQITKYADTLLGPDKERLLKKSKELSQTVRERIKLYGGDMKRFFADGGHRVFSDYKDLVITAYNDLSKLQSLSKAEAVSDHFIITDDASCENLADTLVTYIAKGFSVFKTGFDLFDNVLNGVESSSVHLISAPSNHGKSLMCINMCKRMIEANISDFDKKDAILFVTTEDDIHKLSRRFISIFGNYKFESVRQLYAKAYDVTRTQQIMGMSVDTNNQLNSQIQKMFKSLLKASLLKVTQGKVSLVLKHCNENSFSPGDLGRFLDRLKVEGYKPKLIFVD